MDAHSSNLLFRPPHRRTAPLSVHTIAIDAPGILFDSSIWQRWLFQLLNRVGLQSEFEVFFRLWDEEYQARVASGEMDYWLAMRRLLQASGMNEGRIDEVVAAGQSRRRSMDRPTCPFNGVSRSLNELLSCGFLLVALDENANSSVDLPTLLRGWGMASSFSYIQPAGSGGPVWWESLTDGMAPASTVFLSRSLRRLRAAQRGGCETIHVGSAHGGEIRTISDLRELSACLTLATASKRRAA